MSEKNITHNPINVKQILPFEALPGIFRHTLAYSQDTMLCFFKLEKGAQIPLHDHPNVQIGYILSGRIKFLSEQQENEFIAVKGDSYVFESNEKHGADVLEDTELIEVFYPSRPEYIPRT